MSTRSAGPSAGKGETLMNIQESMMMEAMANLKKRTVVVEHPPRKPSVQRLPWRQNKRLTG